MMKSVIMLIDPVAINQEMFFLLQNGSDNMFHCAEIGWHCKAFLPYLRSRSLSSPSPSSPRVIANFGSIASWRGGPGYALCAATKSAISSLSESLRAELSPLGIHVTVIEPGYFRTEFLKPSAQVRSAKTMAEYEASSLGETRRMESVNEKQPGDVVRGSRVIVDILTSTGKAQGRCEVPERVPLGRDAHVVVRGKCEETMRLLGAWEGVTDCTDYLGGEEEDEG